MTRRAGQPAIGDPAGTAAAAVAAHEVSTPAHDALQINFTATTPASWNLSTPADVELALNRISVGEFAYGKPEVPPIWRDDDVSTDITTVPPDFSTAVVYATGVYPLVRAGNYESRTSFFPYASTVNARLGFNVRVNGNFFSKAASVLLGAANAAQPVTGLIQFVLPVNAPITVELVFWKEAGSPTSVVGLYNGYNSLARVAEL